MANEVQVSSSMSIRKGSLQYARSQPTTFNEDVDAANPKGPTPGAITATTAGVNVDLSELTTPGMIRVANHDETNFVELGLFDPETSTFYPMFEYGPGKSYVARLSRNFGQEGGTGAGTSGPTTNVLRVRADTASCNVTVEAFEA